MSCTTRGRNQGRRECLADERQHRGWLHARLVSEERERAAADPLARAHRELHHAQALACRWQQERDAARESAERRAERLAAVRQERDAARKTAEQRERELAALREELQQERNAARETAEQRERELAALREELQQEREQQQQLLLENADKTQKLQQVAMRQSCWLKAFAQQLVQARQQRDALQKQMEEKQQLRKKEAELDARPTTPVSCCAPSESVHAPGNAAPLAQQTLQHGLPPQAPRKRPREQQQEQQQQQQQVAAAGHGRWRGWSNPRRLAQRLVIGACFLAVIQAQSSSCSCLFGV